MRQLIEEIREAARKLLREKQVEVVIGYERGSLPNRSRPCFIRKEEDIDRLIWDGFCDIDLACYLPGRKGNTAIVAKGCNSRAVVELINENQITRDRIFIIGVACKGMIDRSRIEAQMGCNIGIIDDDEKGEKLIIKSIASETTLDRNEFLFDACRTCTHPVPEVYDKLLGQPETGVEITSDFSDVEAFANLSQEDRWAYLVSETSKCIRCYACRNACPLCYCRECFVDATQPQWVGKSTGLSDTMIFHLMRAFHLAGRCVNCGACEHVCPTGVDIRKLNRKLQKDVKDLFNHEAGLSISEVSPLATFCTDDPEPHMVSL